LLTGERRGRYPFSYRYLPPGYVHGSIPELTIDEPSSRVGEIQTACYLLREAKTFCVYAAVSPAIQAGLIGIGRSTIGKRMREDMSGLSEARICDSVLPVEAPA